MEVSKDRNENNDENDENESKIARFILMATTWINGERFGFCTPKKASADVQFEPFSVRFGSIWRPQMPVFTPPFRKTSSQMWHVPHFVKQIFE
jgi:hypothetical protein